MDLREARIARGLGAHDRALRLYRCLPARERTFAQAEMHECVLELTSSRRVIDDLMRELNLPSDSYAGFSHLKAPAPAYASRAGLRKSFVTLSVTGNPGSLAKAAMADEVFDSHRSIDAARAELAELDIPMTRGARLALARAHMRASEWDPAISHLQILTREAPSHVAVWNELTTALLARGRIDRALEYAYLATQIRRNRSDLYAGSDAQVLEYCGYTIYFSSGMFVAFRQRRSRTKETPGRLSLELRPIATLIAQRLRIRLRGLTFAGLLGWLTFWRPRTAVVAKSEDLRELIGMLDRLVFGKRRAAKT
jgi:tetratricopeptide (TPR) repeat protein